MNIFASVAAVLLQGVLSFFSPCILPLVPLYMGYLSSGAKTVDEDGTIHYRRSTVLLNTACFVLGISFAFFLLGFGFTAAGQFFRSKSWIFACVGGVVVILFGLWQLLGQRPLGREIRLPFHLNRLSMNPFIAVVFGFCFSFAWTPCVGPALTSVLLMAAASETAATAYLLIGVYTIGFAVPFLVLGFFTGALLDLLKKHQKIVQYTVKLGGILMIVMGVLMIAWNFDGICGVFSNGGSPAAGTTFPSSSQASSSAGGSSLQSVGEESSSVSSEPDSPASAGSDGPASVEGPSGTSSSKQNTSSAATSASGETGPNSSASAAPSPVPTPSSPPAAPPSSAVQAASSQPDPYSLAVPNFTLYDQNGSAHTLSDYKGKVVFLNFWATWCGPCNMEMPDIQAVYEKYGKNTGDDVVLGVASPPSDQSSVGIRDFLKTNGYTYPVVMDESGAVFYQYSIRSIPMTYIIAPDGSISSTIPGSTNQKTMEALISRALD